VSLFVTFEGPDGSGKTTQILLLRAALEERGLHVLATREPGGTRIGNAIRALVLDPEKTEMSPRAETLLYVAARAQIVHEIIRPALAAGAVVLCDRYGDSTLAYQGYGHTQPLDDLRALNAYATGGLQPDLTLYIDIDVATGLRRKPAGALDRLEANALAFHEAVRAGYHVLADAEPARWLVLDGAEPIEALHAHILARVIEALYNQS
jgi:dTMP kinase